MKYKILDGRTRSGICKFGSFWDKGRKKTAHVDIISDGRKISHDDKIAAYWMDGSVKAIFHTVRCEDAGDEFDLTDTDIDTQCEDLEADKLKVTENDECIKVETGRVSFEINKSGQELISHFYAEMDEIMDIKPVMILERVSWDGNVRIIKDEEFTGVIDGAVPINEGKLSATFKVEGRHIDREYGKASFPFVIYITAYAGMGEISLSHTFIYDGNSAVDRLKGIGIKCATCSKGEAFNRHIGFTTDTDMAFHETAIRLESRIPKTGDGYLLEQAAGERIDISGDDNAKKAVENLPVWNEYSLMQDSDRHYVISKRTGDGCAAIKCAHGCRNEGACEIAYENVRILAGIRDFWQRYPSEIEIRDLSKEESLLYLWFYSPKSCGYDFSHYDKRMYSQTSYEGFEYMGEGAYGIAATSKARIGIERLHEKNAAGTERKEGVLLFDEKELKEFAERTAKPPVYVTSPQEYRKSRVFGEYSLPEHGSEVREWIENQLNEITEFYLKEIEARSWYGFFDYGDVMHSYDAIRHKWKYDVGGFAWQNTELIPTYWLWFYFLRSGDSRVFDMMEAMSRHTSEIDIYHIGDIKGMGSRHNVLHWGCSCKEPRISMAGHHRFCYYLTGDDRLAQVMAEEKDADKSLAKVRYFMQNGKLMIRTGPDWTSFLSNWETYVEQTLNKKYIDKIKTGIDSIKKAPLKFESGPAFLYDPETGKLEYAGESDDTGDMHLQVCMGGVQVWLELCYDLEDEEFKEMLADHGAFYFLTPDEKRRATGGKINKREYHFPYFAAALGAYSARERNDRDLAEKVWRELLSTLIKEGCTQGFRTNIYSHGKDGTLLREIPWLKTNFASQWSINMIMALEFIADALPDTMEKVFKLVDKEILDNYHKA